MCDPLSRLSLLTLQRSHWTLLAITEGNVYKSVDVGVTWTQLQIPGACTLHDQFVLSIRPEATSHCSLQSH